MTILKVFPFNLIEKCYDKKVDALGLAVFRVCYGLVVLAQIYFIYQYRTLIYFQDSLLLKTLFVIWFSSVCLIIVGFQTKISAVINYCLSVLMVYSLKTFTYDFDKIMVAMNFLIIFIPVAKTGSIDRWIKSLKADTGRLPLKTTVLSYTFPVFLCLGLSYFDSIYHKLNSHNWITGLGLWAPMSMPQMTWIPWLDYSFVLHQQWLMYFLNYIVLFFEAVFLFTFWFNPMRVILLIIGLGFHLGIMLAFPIPLFALGCATIYILMVPVSCWRKILRSVSKRGEPPSQTNPVVMEEEGYFSKEQKVVSVTFFLIFCVFMQSAYFFDYVADYKYGTRSKTKFLEMDDHSDKKNLLEVLNGWNRVFLSYAKEMWGVGNHNVFMDYHVNNYRFIYAVIYRDPAGREEWLPIINREGRPDRYLRDRNWSRWTSYVIGPEPMYGNVIAEIPRYLKFWCLQNQISCQQGDFLIKRRAVIPPKQWNGAIFERQQEFGWTDIGRFYLDKDEYEVEAFKTDGENILIKSE